MRKYIIIAVMTVAVLGAGWYGFARGLGKKEVTYNALNEAGLTLATEEAAGDLNDSEKRIVAELQELFSAFTDKAPLYITGSMKAENPADTTEAAYATPFVFYRQDNLVYYATEVQTLLNDSTAYTVADHESRQLLVMPPRSIAAAQMLPLPSLSKSLKEDGYVITRKEEEGIITFHLLNENHITCKEMRVKVNATTKALVSVYYRFTDIDHPAEKEWDKEMILSVNDWYTGQQAVATFTVPRLVQRSAGSLTAAKEYLSYEITDLSAR